MESFEISCLIKRLSFESQEEKMSENDDERSGSIMVVYINGEDKSNGLSGT
jgi:hypothetical protein